MDDLKNILGFQYLLRTKFDRNDLRRMERPLVKAEKGCKRYDNTEKIALEVTGDFPDISLWQSLQERRSRRKFTGTSLAKRDLAILLWAAQGITAQAGNYYLRTAPSAGALYPVETYVVIEKVEEISAGIYHFDPYTFSLETLSRGPSARLLASAALEQNFIASAAVSFVWTAVMRRNMVKYGHRGMRYIMMDVGHICQNLLLAATALGCDACPVAAFYDEEINRLIDVDGTEESVVYLAAVGG